MLRGSARWPRPGRGRARSAPGPRSTPSDSARLRSSRPLGRRAMTIDATRGSEHVDPIRVGDRRHVVDQHEHIAAPAHPVALVPAADVDRHVEPVLGAAARRARSHRARLRQPRDHLVVRVERVALGVERRHHSIPFRRPRRFRFDWYRIAFASPIPNVPSSIARPWSSVCSACSSSSSARFDPGATARKVIGGLAEQNARRRRSRRAARALALPSWPGRPGETTTSSITAASTAPDGRRSSAFTRLTATGIVGLCAAISSPTVTYRSTTSATFAGPSSARLAGCQLEHDAPALAAVRVAELQLHTAGDDHRRVLVQHAEHLDRVGGPISTLTFCATSFEPLELLGEDAGHAVAGSRRSRRCRRRRRPSRSRSSSKPSPKPIVVVQPLLAAAIESELRIR